MDLFSEKYKENIIFNGEALIDTDTGALFAIQDDQYLFKDEDYNFWVYKVLNYKQEENYENGRFDYKYIKNWVSFSLVSKEEVIQRAIAYFKPFRIPTSCPIHHRESYFKAQGGFYMFEYVFFVSPHDESMEVEYSFN